MTTWAIILAAGQGSRLKSAGLQEKKQFLLWKERPLFWHAARTFARVPRIFGMVFVFPEADFIAAQEHVINLDNEEGLGLPWLCVTGGPRRQDSVACALAALPSDCTRVLVHDAARPFASARLCNALLDVLEQHDISGAIPVVPLHDTVKRVELAERPDAARCVMVETLPRNELRAVQTPQAFRLEDLRTAHARAAAMGWEVTDDASMLERLDLTVAGVPGEEGNVKITTPKDLDLLVPQSPAPGAPSRRHVSGWGYDVHRYVPADHPKARPMKLGGVPIMTGQNGPHILAHSDGDVLLHALTDALLGCLGQGDIGDRFPDTDPALDNVPSCVLLDMVLQDALSQELHIEHVDLTLIAQIPKIAPHKQNISDNIAKLLHLSAKQVNVKATTEEGLGFTGEKKGIKAVALVNAYFP